MTTGWDGSGAPSAADFARRREERHRTARRRAALVGVVLVLVGAVAAGVLVAYGLGDDDVERDAEGRVVPAAEAVAGLDSGSAPALVAGGTWPGGEDVDGMPSDDAGRIGWLLSEVAWDDEQADLVGAGLADATLRDPELTAAMASGVAGARTPLLPALRDDVMAALGQHRRAVAATLAGEEVESDEPVFEDGSLLATFAAVGFESAAPLEDPLLESMTATWPFAVDERGSPRAVGEFREGYRAAFRRSVQPVVLLYAALARGGCGDGVDEACRDEVAARTSRADALFAQQVLDSIPRDLLPPAVARALGDDAAPRRRLPPDAARQWERFRQRQGYGVTGPVLDALAG